MGLLDSIKDAASSAVDAVGDGIDNATKTVSTIAKKVEQAPAAIASGAKQALEGVKDLGEKFVKDPGGTLKSAAKQAVQGAKAVGKWAWEHKAEIGFWVGTTALMLALPVTGGASGAMAGGMMAARGAAIAAKVAQAGRVGATAVRAARAGATALQAARGAVAATKVGAAATRAGTAVQAGRIALGGTKAGRAMVAAQKPVTAASTVIAGVNFADTSRRFAKGEAGATDLALATLGFAPAGFASVSGAAARRAATANAKAATVVTSRLDDIAAQAAGATDEAATVAKVAPTVDAPRTAGAAAEVRDHAATTVDRAVRLRDRAALTTRSVNAEDAISASSLVDELDAVARRAGSARARAVDAAEHAPDNLTPLAQQASDRLSDAQRVATRASRDIRSLASTQRRADAVADGAGVIKDALGTTALHATNLNDGARVLADHDGLSLKDGSLARGILTWLLGRNARVAPVGSSAAPTQPPTAARAA
jgi:hypothetical protein